MPNRLFKQQLSSDKLKLNTFKNIPSLRDICANINIIINNHHYTHKQIS